MFKAGDEVTVLSEIYAPAMGAVSNRRVLERLQAWGATYRVNGDWAKVILPTAMGTIKLRAPQCHKRNAPDMFYLLLERMGLSWAEFWTATPPPPPDIEDVTKTLMKLGEHAEKILTKTETKIDSLAAKEQAAIEYRQRQAEQAAAARAEREAREAAATTTADAQPRGLVIDLTRKSYRKGAGNRIFDYLVQAGEACSISRIAADLGYTHAQISGSCQRLVATGVVERVKSGVYRVPPEMLHQEVRVDVVARAERPPFAAEPLMELEPPDQEVSVEMLAPPPPPLVPAHRQEADPASDELLNEVLDLMFPAGFKAKHLARIDEWRAVTKALIREIGGDDGGS